LGVVETFAVALVGGEDRGWLVETASAEGAIDLAVALHMVS